MVIAMVAKTLPNLRAYPVRNAIVVMTDFTYKHRRVGVLWVDENTYTNLQDYYVGVVCANDNTEAILHFMINSSVIAAYGKEYIFDELVFYFENYQHQLPKMCIWDDDSYCIIDEYQQ